ncbi:MAG: choice-of-anchor L domain-containing protein, partial [Bacteroidia bacterium]|nr:choice-of-anchor L domain-containing protein [Bacteroidia bacterium]
MKTIIKLCSIALICSLFCSVQSFGQLAVAGGMTPNNLVQTVLVGNGVTVTNVTATGPTNCLGSFSNGNTTNLGLTSGVIMSTGGFANVPNANGYFLSNSLSGAGDPLLAALSGGFTSYDAVVLEFDFIPLSNVVNFRYVFGSEEYPEYVCSNFNDAFGFFVSGPNPLGGTYTNQNIAIIPGTTLPVTINSVNSGFPGSYGTTTGCTSLSYNVYYVNNTGSTICFDGFTTPLTATVNVVPCQQYHIKLAISDIGDGAYDSGVFLEANSFQADAIGLGAYYTNPALGLSAIEGCTDGIISFTLDHPATTPIVVNYTIGGTAIPGTDYTTIPTSVTIPAGSDSVGIIINSIMDGLTEGTETVVLHVQTSPCGTEDITLNIIDNTPVQATVTSDQTICDGAQPVNFSVAASGGIAPLTLAWSGGLPSNSNITISPPVGTHSYTVTATDACGATVTDGINITVNATPTSNFTLSTPICAGEAATINYLGTGGSVFPWNFGGGTILSGTAGTAGPFTITWYAAGTYMVSLQTVAANGCPGDTIQQFIQVLGAGTPNCCVIPTPDAGPNLSFCGLSGQFQAVDPDNPSYTGTWTQLTGPGISTYGGGNNHLTYSEVNVTQPGTYTYQWNEVNGPCDSLDVVTLTFIQDPVAHGGTDTAVCGLNYTMIAQMSTPGTGSWAGAGVITPSSPGSSVIAPGYGTFQYIWTETNTGCVSKDTINIEFMQVPVADAGPDATACGNRYTLSADSTYSGYWTGPLGVIYIDGFDHAETGIVIPSYSGTTYSTSFTWHALNGNCTDTDPVSVTFTRPPHAEAGPPQDVCGTIAIMNPDTIGSGIVNAYWTSLPTGPVITAGLPPTPYNATADVSLMGNSAYHFSVGEYYLVFIAQNGIGCSGSDTVRITYYDVPVTYAGKDTSICGKAYDLEANWSIDNPVGIWSTISGPVGGSANFVSPNDPLSDVTVTEYGTYQFVWKESNAAHTVCSDRDTVSVEFKIVPMPDAGLDFSVCGRFANIHATTSVANGTWSGPSGIAYYNGDNGTYTPAYQDSANSWIRWPSENDTITMYWFENNGVCTGYDSVNVYFSSIQTAEHLVDPADSVVCGPVYTLLNAQQPAYGSGYWMDTVMLTTFTPSPTNPSPIASIDTGGVDYYGYHHFYWITVNGICRDTSEVVPVKFIEMPVANAGPNYWSGLFGNNHRIKTDTVCGLNYEMGAVPSIGDGHWYSLDPTNVHFHNSTGPQQTTIYNDSLYITGTSYTVFNATGPKYREFIWQENHEGCVNSDTLRLYFAPHPSGTFTTTMPACRHDSSMIIANTWPLPGHVDYMITNYEWVYTNGSLSPVILNTTVSDTIYVSWSTGEQHNVTLITTNTWGCRSGIVTNQVVEPAPFNPSYDLTNAHCMECNGEILLSTANGAQTNYYTFNWTDTAFINPSALLQTQL